MYKEFHGEKFDNKCVDELIREYFPDYNYHGIFFDVGAFDPILISNSYHFEKNGWTTYCFEANTDLIPVLRQYRKNVIHTAVYDEDKPSVEFSIVTNEAGLTSGYSAIEVSEDYKVMFGKDNKISNIKKIVVPQNTLNTLINNYCPSINHIDVISIDVEGGELKVLQGLNIEKYKPTLFVIENVMNCKLIQSYLENRGYTLNKQVSYNQFYLRNKNQITTKEIEFPETKLTSLCDIMVRYGSDKSPSPGGWNWHNYTQVYYYLFKDTAPLNVFELGLGTNNMDVPSNMGPSGRPGASLRGWAEFFPNANIYGADIDRRILFNEGRIKTYYCDQLNTAAIAAMWQQIEPQMDIIIEDGLHTYEANVSFFENSFQKVKSGGYYIIEDVNEDTIDAWVKKLPEWEAKYPIHQVEILKLKHKNNNHDNNLIVIRKA